MFDFDQFYLEPFRINSQNNIQRKFQQENQRLCVQSGIKLKLVLIGILLLFEGILQPYPTTVNFPVIF